MGSGKGSSRAAHLALALVVATALAACGQVGDAAPAGGLKVVATTTIVGDVVRQVGGDSIDLTVLLPVGADPHSFEATPQDAARLSEANVVFANGAGLEAFLEPLLANVSGAAEVVDLSAGIELLEPAGDHEEEAEHGHEHEAGDPHVWTDPNNVLVWVDNVEASLTRLDPQHAEEYRGRAEAYRAELRALDGWVAQQVALIPLERRRLVTDHLLFGYFAARYGLEQVGAVVAGYSTVAQPSAQELAALQDAIRDLGVPAVFVGRTVNPALAEQVARDTGVQLVQLYTGSLTGPEGDAPTYLAYMRANVTAMVEALK